MKVEGGWGNKNNYTNVFLRLCINIHPYIDAQSHLLHTLFFPLSLSLPLSLPLIHTHTHTHIHTHTTTTTITTTTTLTQSKSGRYELIRFLKVEEIPGTWCCNRRVIDWARDK